MIGLKRSSGPPKRVGAPRARTYCNAPDPYGNHEWLLDIPSLSLWRRFQQSTAKRSKLSIDGVVRGIDISQWRWSSPKSNRLMADGSYSGQRGWEAALSPQTELAVQVSIEQDPRFPSKARSQVKIAHRRSVSLRIMVLSDARCGRHSASEAIVQAAHDLHLAQPVVTGVTTGFRRLIGRFLGVKNAAPVTVEIIDSRDKLEALVRKVRCILPDALISWEAVELWVPLEVIE